MCFPLDRTNFLASVTVRISYFYFDHTTSSDHLRMYGFEIAFLLYEFSFNVRILYSTQSTVRISLSPLCLYGFCSPSASDCMNLPYDPSLLSLFLVFFLFSGVRCMSFSPYSIREHFFFFFFSNFFSTFNFFYFLFFSFPTKKN